MARTQKTMARTQKTMARTQKTMVVLIFAAALSWSGTILAKAEGPSLSLEEAEQLFAEVNRQLREGRWADAGSVYRQLSEADWHAPELYHNLAVAHQRLDEPKRALINGYRVWLLQPFSSDAREQFVTLAEEAELAPRRRNLAERQVTVTAWLGLLGLGGLVAFWAGLFIWVAFARMPVVRAVGMAGVVLGLIAGGGVWLLKRQALEPRAAWVVGDSAVPLRASHGEGSPRLRSLPPFTAVTVTAERDGWRYVTAQEEGASGWLPASQVEPLQPWLGNS